jgi:hypothetical protein
MQISAVLPLRMDLAPTSAAAVAVDWPRRSTPVSLPIISHVAASDEQQQWQLESCSPVQMRGMPTEL